MEIWSSFYHLSREVRVHFSISDQPLDPVQLKRELFNDHAGCCVIFEGWVRDHNEGRSVHFLEYEAYEALCKHEALAILGGAMDRYEITRVDCVHRVGKLDIGEVAIWIGAAAAHRQEAFRACQYVIDEIKLRLPVWKKEHYTDGDAEWVNCQEYYKHSHHDHRDKEEGEYYSKQTTIPEFGIAGQERLKRSSALVVGAGGLGCPALFALAGAGVGIIKIVDGDRLEASNLHRQTLYSHQDIGGRKAILAEEAIKRYNPFIRVEGVVDRVNFDNAQETISGFDVVLDCTDNFKSKYLLHDTCRYLNIPLVQASIYKYEGEVEVFMPDKEAPCLRCYAPLIPEEGCTGNCEEVGVFGFTTNVVGSIQAQKAIDVLLERAPRPGKTLIDLREHEITQLRLNKNKDCPFCREEITLIPEEDLTEYQNEWDLSLQKSRSLKIQWIDIREADERRGDLSAEILHLPLSNPRAYRTLDDAKNYLLICQRGARSSRLAEELHIEGRTGFFSLIGGVDRLNEIKLTIRKKYIE